MKLLHTSDWHLGCHLYGKKRINEHERFLEWLHEIMEEQAIDILCIAGDIFDTTTPSNRAQSLYFRFLRKILSTACSHVIIIGGNHDSPTLLEAPGELLRSLDIHVIGSKTDLPEKEVLLLNDKNETPLAIVCAVPYLRDRDIRLSRPGEESIEKEHLLQEGIRNHFREVIDHAASIQKKLEQKVPVIVMGHLFMAGGKTSEGDGTRDLYVGSLAPVGSDIFPEIVDYAALGHLHTPQIAGQNPLFRYCGSPLQMSFKEADSEKQVLLVEFDHKVKGVTPLIVPCFRELVSLHGDTQELNTSLTRLLETGSNALVEILYTGSNTGADLSQLFNEKIQSSDMEILRTVNTTTVKNILLPAVPRETLEELSENDVFMRCLDANQIAANDRNELIRRFNDVLMELGEADRNAE